MDSLNIAVLKREIWEHRPSCWWVQDFLYMVGGHFYHMILLLTLQKPVLKFLGKFYDQNYDNNRN